MLIRRGVCKSAAVRRLQEALEAIGYKITSPDGDFDLATEQAVKLFQRSHGLQTDGIVGPKTWAALEAALKAGDRLPALKPWLVDAREHPAPKYAMNTRDSAAATAPQGVVLHQTSVQLSSSPSRWKTLNAHLGLMSDGRVVLVNDPAMPIWHAHGLSSNVGIEISGNFCGIEGQEGTLYTPGGGPDRLTEAQKSRVGDLFDWLWAWFQAAGSTWRFVYAHRQASQWRRGDPGEEIWRTFGAPWGDRLRDRGVQFPHGPPGFCVGRGRPLPREWGGEVAVKY